MLAIVTGLSHCSFNLHFSNGNDIGHLFVFLLAICMSSSVNYIFMSFAHFLIGWFGFLLGEFFIYSI